MHFELKTMLKNFFQQAHLGPIQLAHVKPTCPVARLKPTWRPYGHVHGEYLRLAKKKTVRRRNYS